MEGVLSSDVCVTGYPRPDRRAASALGGGLSLQTVQRQEPEAEGVTNFISSSHNSKSAAPGPGQEPGAG